MIEPEGIPPTLRARLATESRLTQRQNELQTANRKIAEQARRLTDEVIRRREEAVRAKSEADALRGKNRAAVLEVRRAASETRMAERRLWASVESIEDGFAVFDGDRKISAANRAFFRPFADLDCVKIGTTYDELVDIAADEGLIDPGNMTPREWAWWMKSRWEARLIEPVTIRFYNDRFVRLSERQTQDGDMVMLAVNMTRAMRREKTLNEARNRAEAANRAKSAFLANMSHEIRTPMNGVLAMAELLAEGELDADQALCVDTIRSSGEALLVIINDVLDYSKIEARKLQLIEEPFDLEQVIGDVVTLLRHTARDKGVSIVSDFDMFLPTGYIGDKGRIRQILMNLVGNAVKFTPEGHVLIRVVGLPEATPDEYRLHITVEDTGIGIPDDKRDHIFGEFNQADGDSTREFDGTGLGLAITRRLVELMDGEIWVESEVGEGSVFGIRLTMRADVDSPAEPSALPTEGQRILICDPDETERAVLSKQLMALGLHPEVCETPGEAGPSDIIAYAQDGGPTSRIFIRLGADTEEEAWQLRCPVVRNELTDALAGVLKRVPPKEPEAPPDFVTTPRVLAAEDNKTNQLVLRKLLKSLDIELEIVSDGVELVERYKEQPPDLIFTDISMPRMDGFDAARAIRQHSEAQGLPRVPIVAMTAHAVDGTEEEILAAGIDHYLTKPLKKASLIERIEAVSAKPGA